MNSYFGTAKFKRQRGVTLVELMISIGIGVFIMAGVFQLYATTNSNARTSDGTTRIQENARYIFNILEADALQTGNLGCFSYSFKNGDGSDDSDLGRAKTKSRGDILTLNNGDDGTPGELYDLTRMIYGSNDDGANDTDSIVFRYAPTSGAIPVSLFPEGGNFVDLDLSSVIHQKRFEDVEQYQVLLIADCSVALYFMVTNEPDSAVGRLSFVMGVQAPADHAVNPGQSNDSTTLIDERIVNLNQPDEYKRQVRMSPYSDDDNQGEDRPYVYVGRGAYKYSVDVSASGKALGEDCNDVTPEYCALFRDDLEIAEGVHDFQVEYGWQAGGSGLGEVFFGEAGNPNLNWDYVDRVRITISLNSVQSVHHVDGEKLALKTFSRTIALRNQISDN